MHCDVTYNPSFDAIYGTSVVNWTIVVGHSDTWEGYEVRILFRRMCNATIRAVLYNLIQLSTDFT